MSPVIGRRPSRNEWQFLAAPQGSALSADKIEGIGNLEAAYPIISDGPTAQNRHPDTDRTASG
jgi:hypothetical protein